MVDKGTNISISTQMQKIKTAWNQINVNQGQQEETWG